MDFRELSGLASSEASDMIAAHNSYGSEVGIAGHSMVMDNSSGMRIPMTSIFSSIPTPLEGLGTIYSGEIGQGMRQDNAFNLVEPLKKKRGRPKKHGPDGSVALALCHNSSKSDYSKSLSEPTAKRRGRPPGSRKKLQLDALGSRGTSFTPHVITVKAGEDVASQIIAFSQQGRRTICILSANGAVSNVTLHHATTSGEFATYEGQYELISLSGSYLPAKGNDGNNLKTSVLTAALAGSDGRVIAGEVGRMMAASPIQVIIGSFTIADKKKKPKFGPSSGPAPVPEFQANISAATSPPPSRESFTDSEEERRSPINHNNSGYHLQGGLYPTLESFN